jgi:Beta-1,3-glucanase
MQFDKLALVLAAMMAGQTLASPVSVRGLPGPTKVTPGGIEDVIVTKQNTLNGTTAGSGTIQATEDDGAISIIVENNLAGTTSGQVTAYVIGEVNGSPAILQTDGSWYTLPATSAAAPVAIDADYAIPIDAEGSSTTFTVPSYLSSGRIYIADGSLTFYTVTDGSGGGALVEPSVTNPSDPSADVNWGFVEFTNTAAGGMYSNPTYVDFVGLPLGLSLTTTDGAVTSSLGLASDAVSVICEALISQTAVDGYPWASLCQTSTSGDYLRVLAPYDYISTESTAFEGYFDDYVSEVWSAYSTTPLIIDTQVYGNSSCTTSGSDVMTCTDSSLTFAQPTAGDIFSCSTGPFVTDGNDYQIAIVPRLCAAFNRATFLLDGGDV